MCARTSRRSRRRRFVRHAAASLAAYFARARIPITIFVPRHASSPKIQQAQAYGAIIRTVDGDRSAVAVAARTHAAETGAFYASHAWSPFFLAGTQTAAFELLEQLPRTPQRVVVPVGSGTLLLGLANGFTRASERVPELIAVQAELCAPLAQAFRTGSRRRADGLPWSKSIAEGINVSDPPRAQEIVDAVRASGGEITSVSEEDIADAHKRLARDGIYAERTSAAAWAAALRLPRSHAETVVILTGSGLKEAVTN